MSATSPRVAGDVDTGGMSPAPARVDTLTFFAAGEPVPQGSLKAIPHRSTGRVIVTADNPALKAWRAKVTLDAVIAARRVGFVAFDGPVALDLLFTLTRPRTVRRDQPCVRPDVDKLARAAQDALAVAGVLVEDGRVVALRAVKQYGDDPGVRVTVERAA